MKRKTVGFTLVELLVVITIISILMGLLIPAVNAARETARKMECGTKVKNLALAAMQHENTKGYMPGWVDKYGVFPGGIDRSDPANYMASVPRHVKVGGYGVAILPWLDAQPTYEHWTDDSYPLLHDGAGTAFKPTIAVGASNAGAGYHPLAAPNLPNFICPSNPVEDAENGLNSYIINAGMCAYRTPACQTATGGTGAFTATYTQSQAKNNGVGKGLYGLLNRPTAPATHEPGPKIKLDDIKDGKTNTAIYSENIQALPWYFAGFLNGPNLIPSIAGAEDLDFAVANASGVADPLGIGTFNASQFVAGMVWHYEDPDAATLNAATPTYVSPSGENVGLDTFKLHRINGGGNNVSQDIFTLQMTMANCPDVARPSSAHVDGVNMGFADGATRYIASSINYRVYQAMMTPRGKSSDVPWPEFVITDELDE
jgi:prepilin-type N-terminal cleavage/methylation domain-containing protein